MSNRGSQLVDKIMLHVSKSWKAITMLSEIGPEGYLPPCIFSNRIHVSDGLFERRNGDWL